MRAANEVRRSNRDKQLKQTKGHLKHLAGKDTTSRKVRKVNENQWVNKKKSIMHSQTYTHTRARRRKVCENKSATRERSNEEGWLGAKHRLGDLMQWERRAEGRWNFIGGIQLKVIPKAHRRRTATRDNDDEDDCAPTQYLRGATGEYFFFSSGKCVVHYRPRRLDFCSCGAPPFSYRNIYFRGGKWKDIKKYMKSCMHGWSFVTYNQEK